MMVPGTHVTLFLRTASIHCNTVWEIATSKFLFFNSYHAMFSRKSVKYNICAMGMNVGIFVEQQLPHSENI